MKQFKEIFLNTVLLITSLTIFLAFTEITVRTFYPLTLHDTVYDSEKHYYRYEPNTTVIYRSSQLFIHEYALKYSHNSKGFSDTEHAYETPNHKKRIVALGDSFTEGSATEQNKSFIRQLEKNLNLQKQDYEIINLGIGGTGLDNYYFTHLNEGRAYKPDIVLLGLFVGNDITHQPLLLDIVNNTVTAKEPERENSIFLRTRKYLSTHSAAYKFTVMLLSNNKLLSAQLEKLGLFVPTNIDIYNAKNRPEFLHGLKTTFFILDKINILVNKENAKLITLLIPIKEQVDDDRHKKYYEERNIKLFNGQFEAQQEIIKFCRQKKINCIDILPALRKENRNNTFYLNIDGHFNDAGHRKTAEILANSIMGQK